MGGAIGDDACADAELEVAAGERPRDFMVGVARVGAFFRKRSLADRFARLRARLALVVVLASLPPLGLVSYLSYERYQDARHDAFQNALNLARLAANEQSQLIDVTRQLLVILASIPPVRRFEADCNALLAETLTHDPSYTNLGVADASGNVRCSAIPLKSPINIADRDYFRHAVTYRDFGVGNYQIGRATGKSSLNVGYPIVDESHELAGVVYAALSLDWLNRTLRVAGLPAGSSVLLVDAGGTVYARYPKPLSIGKNLRHMPLISHLLAKGGDGVTQGPGLDGVERLHGFAPLRLPYHRSRTLAAYVIVNIPLETALAQARQTAIQSLSSIFLMTLLMIGALWLASDVFILRPATRLTEASRSLTDDDVRKLRKMGARPGELGEVARTLARTAGALRAEQRELARANIALRASEASLVNLIELAPDGIVTIDAAQTIQSFNRGASEIFGYSPEQVIGQPLGLLIPERFRAIHHQHVDDFNNEQVVSRRMGTGREVFGQRKDGTQFPAEVSLTKSPLGPRVMATAIIRDVSERRKAEDEIRQLNAELERKVADRTQELEAALRELEAFSYSVSHDLRSPLRSIDGFSQALLEDYEEKLDDQGKDYLARVRAATQRMGHLIDDLLQLSRLTRSPLNKTRVNVSEMASSIVEALRGQNPSPPVQVRIAPDLYADADPRLLHIALENLLGNAWKFTCKATDPRVEVGTYDDSERGRVFYVRDNGAGFNMAYSDKLFGPFQRLHSVGDFPGTGIGLATVKRIVARHGGNVWAEGTPGAGATFYFTL